MYKFIRTFIPFSSDTLHSMKSNKLILVYNANSGIFAAASDFVKKLTSPDKYDCELCMVTYGSLKMQHPWKEYLATLPFEKLFLHRDEFINLFPSLDTQLPSILFLCEGEKTPKVLLLSEEIKQTKNLQELITALATKLSIKGYPCGDSKFL